MKIVKTSIDTIEKYRTDYLNSLPEFQELFVELMIPNSDCFVFQSDTDVIGYAIRNVDGVLIEFYVPDIFLPDRNVCFRHVLQDLSITDIYCKSFDSQLLSACLSATFRYAVLGMLYRNYCAPLLRKDPAVEMSRADLSSVRLFLGQDDSIRELFETEQQLLGFIEREHVFEFYKNQTFVGCGMVLRTHPGWRYCDIGVWVAPSERGNALGSQIILNLREFSIKNNMVPSCGCAIENIASQKAIEKSGFVSNHRLIHFKVR